MLLLPLLSVINGFSEHGTTHRKYSGLFINLAAQRAYHFWYFRNQKKKSKAVEAKIAQAKIEGLFEPVSLHPVIDTNSCIRTGACVAACPEKDIIGIVNGKATTINASHCIGHGACFMPALPRP